jgi:phage-related protein
MWKVEFYKNRNGRCPTEEFLDSLSIGIDIPFIHEDLDRLAQCGNTLTRPQADYVTDGIYELRTKTRSGQIRFLYFFFHRETIVVTHGFQKKERNLKLREIKKAQAYREDYLTQQNEKGKK